MKYLKTYEDLNEPQIGDKVLCKMKYENHDVYKHYIDDANEFLEYEVGEIIDIYPVRTAPYSKKYMNIYQVKFFKKPKETPHIWRTHVNGIDDTYYSLRLLRDEIITNDQDKIDVILASQKYKT